MSIDLQAQDDLTISGDVVGRDKIINNIQNIVQRALTAAEEAEREKEIEAKYLAQGVSEFARRLQARASDTTDADKRSPYKGLLEYHLNDAEIFFGRSKAIAEVLERLQQGPLTVLHAESGAGKTSLLQAGVAPRLINLGHLPVHIRPYNVEPTYAIKRAFLPDLSATPGLATAPLRDFLRKANSFLGEQNNLYIFLDQFEEFFTQLPAPARPEFVRELAECLDDEALNVRWVLSMRTEFFGNLASFRPLVRNPFENDFRLNHFTRAEAKEVITAPAVRHHITFEAGLVESILNDLGGDNLQPPQIQLVCSALYENLKPGETAITRAHYNANGGSAGILRSHLERVLTRDLAADQRVIAQRALEALITADGRRLIRSRDELLLELNAGQQRKVAPEALEAVLEQLVESNLLRSQEAQAKDGAQTYEAAPGLAYELTHDYLLEQIKMNPAVQARKAAQELLDQELHAYVRYGTLLNADKLAVIKAQQEHLALTDAARNLIRLSEQRLRRQQRIFAGSIGAAIIAVVVAVVFFGMAVNASQRQQIAVSTQFAAQTSAADAAAQQAQAEIAAATAAVSEAEARQREEEARNREAAAKAVVRDLFESEGLVPVGNRPSAFAFDGERLWVANRADDTLQSIDPLTGEASQPISVGRDPSALAFDGIRLWVAHREDNTVQAIDPTTGAAGEPIPVGFHPSALAFDTLRARLWVANADDNSVQAIDPEIGAVVTTLTVGARPSALVFDGTRLWVANADEDSVQSIDPATGDVSLPLAVGANPTSLAFDGTRLWVTNFAKGTVQSIDPITRITGEPIPVGDTPFALVFDGRRVWVANRGSSTVQAIDPDLGTAGVPVRVPSGPTALAFAGSRLWIASQDTRIVQAIAPIAGDLHPPIPVGLSPSALAWDGDRLWVANLDDGTLHVIDPTNLKPALDDGQKIENIIGVVNSPSKMNIAQVQDTGSANVVIPVEGLPAALAFDGTTLWAALLEPNVIQAVDPKTGQVSASIPVGQRPLALIFDGTLLWTADSDDNAVLPIDPKTWETGMPIAVGQGPGALAFDGRRLWVANAWDNTVQAIDLATREAGAPIPVGREPRALAFDGQRIWVANSKDDTVQAIDIATGEVSQAIRTGNYPTALAFDGTRLWVANYWSNTLQAIDPATGKIGAPIAVDTGPYALAFDGVRLWVACLDGNTVQFIPIR